MHESRSVGLFLLTGIVGLLLGASIQAQNGERSADSSAAVALSSLPKDINPESGYRLPLPRRDEMDDYGKKVFDELTDPNRPLRTDLRTPAGIRLYSPTVAKTMSDALYYLRKETGMGDRLTEIAILVTAREMDNQYEWSAHERYAQQAGVEPAIVDIIRYSKPVTGLGEKETLIITFGRELFGQKKVSSPTFAEAVRLFGRRGTVDLASLMGLYSATAALGNALDIQLPEGRKPSLPPR